MAYVFHGWQNESWICSHLRLIIKRSNVSLKVLLIWSILCCSNYAIIFWVFGSASSKGLCNIYFPWNAIKSFLVVSRYYFVYIVFFENVFPQRSRRTVRKNLSLMSFVNCDWIICLLKTVIQIKTLWSDFWSVIKFWMIN